MYLVAICDDETEELDKTEQMLRNYEKKYPQTNFMIECFKNADELIHAVREKDYTPDIILMDIYMPEKMGIEVTKELREMGNKSRVIFLTTSREHALEAFSVDAAQYLVKPVSEMILFPVMDKLLAEIEEKRRKYLLLRIEGKIQRIAVDDIAYCEAQGKMQHLYLTNGMQCLLRTTITEIYEMLSRYQNFVRVGIAYVVNLEHVDSLNAQELQMDNGRKIYLPRGSYRSLREKYFGYYCEEG